MRAHPRCDDHGAARAGHIDRPGQRAARLGASDGIASRIPHAGRMCLLDRVECWDTQRIRCRARSHRDADNPLRAAFGNLASSFLYSFTDWRMWTWLFDVVESSGYGVRQMIVWDKETPGMGRGWRAQHELGTEEAEDAPGLLVLVLRGRGGGGGPATTVFTGEVEIGTP